MRFLFLSHDNVRIVFHARQRFQQRHCSITEMDRFEGSLQGGCGAAGQAFDDFRKAKPPREVAAITLALFIRLRNDLKISG